MIRGLMFIAALSLTACGPSSSVPAAPKVTSFTSNPIYLKELTTGIVLADELKKNKQLRQDLVSLGQNLYNMSYFGETHLLEITPDSQGRVMSIKFMLGSYVPYSLRGAITDKLSETNGKPIRFDCSTKATAMLSVPFKEELCVITHGTQRLELETNEPADRRPAHISEVDWARLKSVKLTLKDTKLLSAHKEEADKELARRATVSHEAAKKDL